MTTARATIVVDIDAYPLALAHGGTGALYRPVVDGTPGRWSLYRQGEDHDRLAPEHTPVPSGAAGR